MSMTSSAAPAMNRPSVGACIEVSLAGSDPNRSAWMNITMIDKAVMTIVTCMTRWIQR